MANRGPWQWVLIISLMVFLIGAVFGLLELRQEFQQDRGEVRGTVLWIATEFNREYWRLLDSLSRYSMGDEKVSQDDFLLRLDIFWAQMSAFKSGNLGRRLSEAGDADELIDQIDATLTDLDPVMLALEAGDAEGGAAIRERLSGFGPTIHQVVQRVDKSENAYFVGVFNETEASLDRLSLMVILMAATGGLLIVLVIRERNRAHRHSVATEAAEKLVREINASLEEKVQERTADLEAEVQERLDAESNLRRTTFLLESSIESPRGMIIVAVDTDYRYLFFTQTHARDMERAYGSRPTPGEQVFDYMSVEGDIQQLKPHYDRALAGEWHSEIAEYGEGESRSYYETLYSPIYGEDRKVIGATAFAQDITERRRMERQIHASLQEKETLLRELYHRTKNNMEVISSILYLAAEKSPSCEVAELVRTIESRIRGMSLVHRMLYQSKDLSRIDLGDYVAQLTDLIMETNNATKHHVELSVNSAGHRILIDTAVPLGLVLNELVSNSVIHAFTDRDDGVVRVGIGYGEPEGISVTVADNGIGFPDDEPQFGTGLQTAVSIVRDQLHGTIEFDGSDGFSCTIGIPRELYAERV